jgi:hypothetical protein
MVEKRGREKAGRRPGGLDQMMNDIVTVVRLIMMIPPDRIRPGRPNRMTKMR